jgi:hypothetical protein
MKELRGSHFLFIIFMCAIVLPLSWNYFKELRTRQEQSRVLIIEKIVIRKLETYQIAHGNYPDSLDELSFTNSTLEIEKQPDIHLLQYKHTTSGYTLKYNSILGFHSVVENDGQ